MNTINLQHPNSESPVRETAPTTERSRVEIPGFRHEPKDVLQQMQANLSLLEDQCGRLGFMLNEIRSVIRR